MTTTWRRPVPSLNYLLSSLVWRQDHNGFSHQDPGFIDHVMTKKAEIIRVYLPPDTNCLLSVADQCLRSRHYVNVIVAGKQPQWNWLSMDDAIIHCTQGAGIWEWASSDAMLNDLDRFHLVMDVIDRVPGLSSSAGHVRQLMANKRLACRSYTRTHGEDAPEIRDWTWAS